ncbi:MAG: hypothetical protein NZ455_07990 [Bacteroidia bacterium]|nr:hypothetical protein [Bacteroidia bacterium]MDW8345938.1 hypothetical protein [Bacteroidia bacterium]
MRRACVSTVRSPRTRSNSYPGGGRVGRSTVSPQHADLAHTSAASRGQGHAQKMKNKLTKIT